VKIWPIPVRSSALGAIEHTVLEPKGHDPAHASSAHEVYIALAAITNSPCAMEILSNYDRAHLLRSSSHRPALERTACDRVQPRDLAAH
jgi:hypothetical protein